MTGQKLGVLALLFLGAAVVGLWAIRTRRNIMKRQQEFIDHELVVDPAAEQAKAVEVAATLVDGPHTYRASIWSRLWLAAMLPVPLLVVLGLSLGLTAAVGDSGHPAIQIGAAIVVAACLVFVALCLRTKITVDGPVVTVQNPVRRHTVTLQHDVIVSVMASWIPYNNGILLTITEPRPAGDVRPKPIKVLATSSLDKETFDRLRAHLLVEGHGARATFDRDFYQLYKLQWT